MFTRFEDDAVALHVFLILTTLFTKELETAFNVAFMLTFFPFPVNKPGSKKAMETMHYNGQNICRHRAQIWNWYEPVPRRRGPPF